jgi:hypothetical protein
VSELANEPSAQNEDNPRGGTARERSQWGTTSGEYFVSEAATPEHPPEPTQPSTPSERPLPSTWEQMGGLSGMLDSALPVIVFVIANAAAGLGWAIGAAIAAAVVIAVIRLLRHEPVGQALGGQFAVAVAAFIANRSGSAKGFFLLGIWSFVVYGVALLISILVRWPLIGVIWENLNGRGNAWRKDRALVRKYDLATALWVLVCAARFVVQRWLYDSDQVGWLAFARIAMGYPLFILVIIGTVLIVNSGSGKNPRQQWQELRERRKENPKAKPLTFKERMALAEQRMDRKKQDRQG